jgi:hypothetical protein
VINVSQHADKKGFKKSGLEILISRPECGSWKKHFSLRELNAGQNPI